MPWSMKMRSKYNWSLQSSRGFSKLEYKNVSVFLMLVVDDMLCPGKGYYIKEVSEEDFSVKYSTMDDGFETNEEWTMREYLIKEFKKEKV